MVDTLHLELDGLPSIDYLKFLIYDKIKSNYDPYQVSTLLNPKNLKLYSHATLTPLTKLPPLSEPFHFLVVALDDLNNVICPHYMNKCNLERLASVEELVRHNWEAAKTAKFMCSQKQCKRRFVYKWALNSHQYAIHGLDANQARQPPEHDVGE